MVPLEAVRELGEEGCRVRVGGKGGGEVVGNVEFAGGVSASVSVTWIGSPPLRPVFSRMPALMLIMCLPPMTPTVVRYS